MSRFVFSTRSELSTAESRIREMLQLDIGLSGDNIQMSNSLGRIRGKFKLRLTGNANFPILNGTCEGSQGEIYFSDRSFNLLKAKLVFNNNLIIDPLITIESEAFIQNYRIRFDIRGSRLPRQAGIGVFAAAAAPGYPGPDLAGRGVQKIELDGDQFAAEQHGHGHHQADRGDQEPGQQAAGDQLAAHRPRTCPGNRP